MKKLWVLVANSSAAKIYTVKGNGKEILKVQELEHPDSRKKGSEILTDRPGRAYDRVGVGRHAIGKDPLIHEHQLFASQLSEVIRKGFDNGDFEQIAIIAPPQFLGEIRLVIPEPVKALVVKEVDKDILPTSSESERLDLICRYLDLWNR